jgi:hypothetical protein
MGNAKHLGYIWALAIALGIGLAAANSQAVASAAPGDSGKGASASESSESSHDTPKPRRHSPKQSDATSTLTPKKKSGTDLLKGGTTNPKPVVTAAATRVPGTPSAPLRTAAAFTAFAAARREFEPSTPASSPAAPAVTTSATDPDFITSTHGFFGLFSVTSAADPDDNHFVAFVLRTPFFTNVLTSGTDPEDNLGFGAASVGVAGHTVNTFISPFLTFSIGIPIEDPFAALFTELVRAGF